MTRTAIFHFYQTLNFRNCRRVHVSLTRTGTANTLIGRRRPRPNTAATDLYRRTDNLFLATVGNARGSLSPRTIRRTISLVHTTQRIFYLNRNNDVLLTGSVYTHFSDLSGGFHATKSDRLRVLTTDLVNPRSIILFVSCSNTAHSVLRALHATGTSNTGVVLLARCRSSPNTTVTSIILQYNTRRDPLSSNDVPVGITILCINRILLLHCVLSSPRRAGRTRSHADRTITVGLV